MKISDPAGRPRRELELLDCELLTLYGKDALRIAVTHKAHRLKNGEQVYKPVVEVYLWERQEGSEYIDLTKTDGTSYTCGPWSCTCKAFEFCKQPKTCKHLESLWRLKMFGGGEADVAACERTA